jgi:hypothetical protein
MFSLGAKTLANKKIVQTFLTKNLPEMQHDLSTSTNSLSIVQQTSARRTEVYLFEVAWQLID